MGLAICFTSSATAVDTLSYMTNERITQPYCADNETGALQRASTVKGQRFPILLVSMSLKYHSASLYDQPLSSCRSFWHKCTEKPKMALNITRSKTNHVCRGSAPKVPHSDWFALRAPIFELQAILRSAREMTPKWPLTLKGQRFLTHVLPVVPTESHISILFALRPTVYKPIWQRCIEWPQNDIEHWGQMYPICCHTTTPKFQISVLFVLRQVVSS